MSKSFFIAYMKRVQCPVCLDSHQDNLIVYDDGHQHCFACGYHVATGEEFTSTSVQVAISGYPAVTIPNHTFITAEALAEFGVLQENSTTLLFPSVDVDNKLVSVKRRDYSLPKKQGITMQGVNTIFGLNRQTNSNTLILVEGEPDAVAMAQLVKQTADVWAIPGASATGYLAKLGHRLQKYSNIYLCFDNDSDGKAAVDRALPFLPEYKVKIVELQGKDTCEVVEAGGNPLDSFYNAKSVENSSVVTGTALVDNYMEYLASSKCKGFDTGWKGLNALLGGSLKPTEVVLLVGHTGRGKSTFTLGMAYNICHLNNTKCLWVSTEMNYEQMVEKAVELDTRGKSNSDPDSIKWVSDNFVFYDDLNTIEQIEQAVMYSISVHNVGLVVIDVISKINKMRDWQYASEAVDRITKVWAQGSSRDKRPPVAVVLVAHSGKTDGRFREHITLDDIGGGTSYIQGVTCILSFMGTVDNPIRTLSNEIKKPRMGKSLVGSVQLEYDSFTGLYSELTYLA